ncbi:MAG: HAD family phosphatase [Planctomycetota bacterium]
MRRPEFVYFDLGNVLLYFDHGIAARAMAKLIGVYPEEIKRLVFDSDFQLAYERGELTSHEFAAILTEKFQKDLPFEDLMVAAADIFVPNMNILPILEKIQRLGIPMGLLSNTCDAHWSWILRMGYPQLQGWFNPVVLSFEVRSMKPEPEIYRVSTELARTKPESIFFTDDRLENIQGAQQAGWNAVQFTSADRLMDVIESW